MDEGEGMKDDGRRLLRECVRMLITESSTSVKPVTDDILRYASTNEDPKYCIRFVERVNHKPDAKRVGNHRTVVNGVYCFPALKEYLSDIVALSNTNEPRFDIDAYRDARFNFNVKRWRETGKAYGGKNIPQIEDFVGAHGSTETRTDLGMYLEDIAVGMNGFVFVLKTTARNPLIVKTEEDVNRYVTSGEVDEKGWATPFDTVARQKELIAAGYDAVYDVNSLIDDNVYMPQVVFLTNDAFQVVDVLRMGNEDPDKIRNVIVQAHKETSGAFYADIDKKARKALGIPPDVDEWPIDKMKQ